MPLVDPHQELLAGRGIRRRRLDLRGAVAAQDRLVDEGLARDVRAGVGARLGGGSPVLLCSVTAVPGATARRSSTPSAAAARSLGA